MSHHFFCHDCQTTDNLTSHLANNPKHRMTANESIKVNSYEDEKSPDSSSSKPAKKLLRKNK